MDVALTVGGSFLSAFLRVLFDRLASPEFVHLFRKKKIDKELLQKLKMNLLAVGAVLDDAENKQTRNQSIKGWLDELHDTIYQTDDLLDEINTEALRMKVEAEDQYSPRQVNASTYSSSFSYQFLKKMMQMIEKMIVRLDWFIQQINPIGLQVVEPKMQSCRAPSTSLVDETTVYGRDIDKVKIMLGVGQPICASKPKFEGFSSINISSSSSRGSFLHLSREITVDTLSFGGKRRREKIVARDRNNFETSIGR